MKEKAIDALRQQIVKLEEKNFDLESWKTGTSLILARLFGEGADKVLQIRKLQLDFSSWTLRDTSGEGDPLKKIQRMARDILEACITEIEIFGIPGSAASEPAIEAIAAALREHLRMQELKQLLSIINAGQGRKEKQEKILDLLLTLPPKIEREILISLLSHPSLKDRLANG